MFSVFPWTFSWSEIHDIPSSYSLGMFINNREQFLLFRFVSSLAESEGCLWIIRHKIEDSVGVTLDTFGEPRASLAIQSAVAERIIEGDDFHPISYLCIPLPDPEGLCVSECFECSKTSHHTKKIKSTWKMISCASVRIVSKGATESGTWFIRWRGLPWVSTRLTLFWLKLRGCWPLKCFYERNFMEKP